MVGKEGEEIRGRMASLKEKARLCLMEGGSSYKSLESLQSETGSVTDRSMLGASHYPQCSFHNSCWVSAVKEAVSVCSHVLYARHAYPLGSRPAAMTHNNHKSLQFSSDTIVGSSTGHLEFISGVYATVVPDFTIVAAIISFTSISLSNNQEPPAK
ncbi:hypothetical protein Ancab_034417 [Ancistrocladus abbreviatus]